MSQKNIDQPPSGTLSPERLAAIRRQVRSGFYDLKWVLDTVARRLAELWGGNQRRSR